VRVRIQHAGANFKAIARVTENVSTEGMGIEFVEIGPDDRAALQKWLAGETPVNDTSTKLFVTGLLLIVCAAVIAAAALMFFVRPS
jgi:hypothetical protein